MLEQHRWENWVAHLELWKSHPVHEALNTHEGGYVMALAFAFILPVIRATLRSLLWEVLLFASPIIAGNQHPSLPF